MDDKTKCIQFYKWIQRLHYTGFPTVQVKGSIVRDMTIDELYDHYSQLSELEQKTAFINDSKTSPTE